MLAIGMVSFAAYHAPNNTHPHGIDISTKHINIYKPLGQDEVP